MSTVKDALAQFYAGFRKNITPSKEQSRAALSIIRCKTASMGGHVQKCDECNHMLAHYNSCRNRHCPMCQGITNALWVDKRASDVINAPYFHTVFTMPEELHELIYQNQKLLYALMFRAVKETLTELSSDPKYLGAQIGFISVLHTWSQDLRFHPHLHNAIMAGGLTKSKKWRSSSKDFFIPVKVLAKKFRGKYLYYLKQYYAQGKLQFYRSAGQYADPASFQRLIDRCYEKDWYIYTKKTFSGPLAVLKYLGNYTRRTAISNSRIASVDKHTVTLKLKDRNADGKAKP